MKQEAQQEQPFYTVKQFHQKMAGSMSLIGIYAAVSHGAIEHIRIGKKILIPARVLEGKLSAASGGPGPSERGYLTIEEAAAWSGIPKKVVKQAAKDAQFPVHQNGQGIVIPKAGFEAWFAAGRPLTPPSPHRYRGFKHNRAQVEVDA